MAGRCIGPVPYPGRLALLRTRPGRAQRRDLPPASLPPGYRQGLQGRVLRPRAPPRTAAALQRILLRGIRADIRRYHIGAVLIDPLFGHDPVLAIRYMTAATRQQPQRAGGVLGWFHLDR